MTKKEIKYKKKEQKIITEALNNGDIQPYPEQLFTALKDYDEDYIPAYLVLFIPELCNGSCYKASAIVALAFPNCRIIHAEIEGLRVSFPDEAIHSYVEVNLHGENWIFDTSMGFMIKSKIYEKLQKPKIVKVIERKDLLDYINIKETLDYITENKVKDLENILKTANRGFSGFYCYEYHLYERLKIFEQNKILKEKNQPADTKYQKQNYYTDVKKNTKNSSQSYNY